MPTETTTCSTPGGHRYDENGRCEWCDAEQLQTRETMLLNLMRTEEILKRRMDSVWQAKKDLNPSLTDDLEAVDARAGDKNG